MPEISGMIQNYLEGQIKTIAGEPVIQSKTITENGIYTAHEGVDGYSPVVVNVPPTEPVIESKTITENGTYTAPEGVDGYSPVVVNVPPTEPVIESKTITENGTYTAPEGVDGYSPVVVNVPAPQPIIESKSITENGTYTAPEGVDGYSPVVVNVPAPQPIIESKSITENGTYTAPEGVDGYSPVIVDVPLPPNAYLLKSVANLPQAIASFNDGEEMVMPSLKVAIEPQQEGSGDPSPTNVRPISGWDEANVVVSPTTDAEDGQTYTIQFKDGDNPLTVYGGTLDVVSGVLTVDKVTKDLGDLSYNYTNNIFVASLGNYKYINNTPSKNSCYQYVGTIMSGTSDMQNKADGTYALYYNANYPDVRNIYIKDSRYTDATAFKTAMSGVQLVYELATPLTIQLSPTAVKSLLGSNNVWADTGDITDAEYFSKEV